MTTDIKSLVENLRKYCWQRIDEEGDQNDSETPYEAADALEAMAGELERLKVENSMWGKEQYETLQMWFRRVEAAEYQRDRLKVALVEIAGITQYLGMPTANKVDDAFQRGLIAGHETCTHIARKALGGDAS